ncbi:MAG: polysaccharide pyruvyl transferase CsaB [Clostridiales bacterium]|nr:polysaccharide pyruvyl transferase CsaB [Clostridiales bacterium]MDY4172636.1 polysaccharide pyruvyl transferase CsaB [Evtepia sp.]
MKVLHLISGGDTGGAKTHVHSLLAGLTPRIQVKMVCFTEGPFAQEARELGIDTQVFPGRNFFANLKKLSQMVREEGFDLIHSHGARGNMMAAFLSKRTGLPTVSTVHSDYRLDYLGRPLSRLTYGTINTIALRKLDYRIGVSDAMVDLLISRRFDPEKLFAIYNGLDFTPRTPALGREEYLRSVGLEADEGSVVAGIAARLNPVKDIATLIRGFALAHAEFPNLRLLIAGDGEEMDNLKALAQELGVAKEVCFAGWVSDTDSFYNALDINTLTSISETFPYSLTEGARAGLPTISSKVGGVSYLIDHGSNGYLFPPGDHKALAGHLLTLARDPALRKSMGRRLYEKANREFSIEATIQRQLEIYEAILRYEKTGRDRVIICGAYGRGNAGDDAILLAILTELRAINPDLSFQVFSRNPLETRKTYRVNAFYIFHVWKALYHFKRAKFFINGGGSLMQDVTSFRSLWFYLWTLAAAKRHGCPVIMYGCGIGPIRNSGNRVRAAKVMNRYVDAITLRDPDSLKELEVLGVTQPKIALSADTTVSLPAAPGDVIDGILDSLGIPVGGNYVGFVLRPWPGFEVKAKDIAAAADYVYETYGLTPVFFPIEPRLDVTAAQRVVSRMKAPYYMFTEPYTAAQTIGILARMKVVVSMRLHGLIFSAGQGVPLVGIVYDQKVISFLSYIGQDLYEDLHNLTAEGLKALIDQAVSRGKDPEFLSESVEKLRRMDEVNRKTLEAYVKQAPEKA